jgi:hypothetical protein
MQVTQKVTPVNIRVVVRTTDNLIYVAHLTQEQLTSISEDYALVFKRHMGSLKLLQEITEKENADANSTQPNP